MSDVLPLFGSLALSISHTFALSLVHAHTERVSDVAPPLLAVEFVVSLQGSTAWVSGSRLISHGTNQTQQRSHTSVMTTLQRESECTNGTGWDGESEIGAQRDRLMQEVANKKNKDPGAECLKQFDLFSFSTLQLDL